MRQAIRCRLSAWPNRLIAPGPFVCHCMLKGPDLLYHPPSFTPLKSHQSAQYVDGALPAYCGTSPECMNALSASAVRTALAESNSAHRIFLFPSDFRRQLLLNTYGEDVVLNNAEEALKQTSIRSIGSQAASRTFSQRNIN